MRKRISQTTHGFAVQDVLKHTGSAYAKAQADSAANAKVVGMVVAVPNANTFDIIVSGEVTGLTGLTAGSVYYLDASTAGAITTTAPAISRPVLYATSTTTGFFIYLPEGAGSSISTPVSIANGGTNATTEEDAIKNLITGAAAITTMYDYNELAAVDNDGTPFGARVAFSDLMNGFSFMPTFTTPDYAADFMYLYDASASASKKMYLDYVRGQRRNTVVNGDFEVWQRGTSTFTGSNSWTADCWYVANSSDGVIDTLRTADAPTATESGHYSRYCLHVDVTTADASIGASQYAAVWTKFIGEDVRHYGFGQSGTRYAQLSFWHKHTVTGNYSVCLQNAANNRSYVIGYTQSTTNTWEKATALFPVDTTGTWNYGNTLGLILYFTIAVGSTYQISTGSWQASAGFGRTSHVNGLSSTSNDFKIAQVQLEFNSVPTPFEYRQYAEDLRLAQRVFWRLGSTGASYEPYDGATVQSTSVIHLPSVQFPVPMRASPTKTDSGPSWNASGPSTNDVSYYSFNSAGYSTITGSLTITATSSPQVSQIYLTAGTSFGSATAGDVGTVYLGSSAYIDFSCEL